MRLRNPALTPQVSCPSATSLRVASCMDTQACPPRSATPWLAGELALESPDPKLPSTGTLLCREQQVSGQAQPYSSLPLSGCCPSDHKSKHGPCQPGPVSELTQVPGDFSPQAGCEFTLSGSRRSMQEALVG